MTILTNGRIHTMDAVSTVADTLVVRDGRVAFAGRRGDVNVPAPRSRSIDLEGRSVLPGLVDAHGHLMYLARGAPHAGCGRGDVGGRGGAYRGGGGGPGARRENGSAGAAGIRTTGLAASSRRKTRSIASAPRNPVALVRVDGHATWCNSAALHAAVISRTTADPTGGIVVKDARGEPTGLLIDTAQRLVQRAEPMPSEARFDEAVRAAIAQCLAVGLTGIHEMGVTLFGLACVSPIDRARPVRLPQLRGRRRPLGGDVGLLSRARPRGDRRRARERRARSSS